MTILEIIQKLLEEQNLDEIDPKKVIFLDEYGNEVVKDMHLAEFLGSLKMDYIDCEEKTDIKVFIFGDDYSSENDLTFVNQVWKKYENYAGKPKLHSAPLLLIVTLGWIIWVSKKLHTAKKRSISRYFFDFFL